MEQSREIRDDNEELRMWETDYEESKERFFFIFVFLDERNYKVVTYTLIKMFH